MGIRDKFSAVLKVNLADSYLNVLLDTGASCSLIDLGSLEKLGLDKNVEPLQHRLMDASGNKMNIMGTICVQIRIKHKIIFQRMKVLNSKSNRNILLGRDFLSQFRIVEFDFENNRIMLCSEWHNYVPLNVHLTKSRFSASQVRNYSECSMW